MSLRRWLANSNGNPEKTILALRLINKGLKITLSRHLNREDANTTEDCHGDTPRTTGKHIPKKSEEEILKTASLLERLAFSDGNSQRTIEALRLFNDYLERELDQLTYSGINTEYQPDPPSGKN